MTTKEEFIQEKKRSDLSMTLLILFGLMIVGYSYNYFGKYVATGVYVVLAIILLITGGIEYTRLSELKKTIK